VVIIPYYKIRLHTIISACVILKIEKSQQPIKETPITVAARPKAWVCGRSLVGVAGSNPAGVMTIS